MVAGERWVLGMGLLSRTTTSSPSCSSAASSRSSARPSGGRCTAGPSSGGYLQSGQLATVQAWLDALPEPIVAEHPALSLARAWVALDSGDLPRA